MLLRMEDISVVLEVDRPAKQNNGFSRNRRPTVSLAPLRSADGEKVYRSKGYSAATRVSHMP
jgi:hypothetical protein